MGKDYYQTLELPRAASQIDIQKAYRRLSLKWHPSKHAQDITTAQRKFHDISEAYEVLADPARRAFFDQYGEERLKQGMADSAGIFRGGYRYQGNADEIFELFFGSVNPFYYENLGEGEVATMFGSAFGGLQSDIRAVNEDLQVTLPCTLPQLYNGCMREISYQRRVLNADRRTTRLVSVTKQIQVHRGYGKDTKLRFENEGHEHPTLHNSALVVQIVEEPHAVYRRKGNDLVMIKTLSLLEALEAWPLQITTLDGRVLTESLDQVINPKTVKVLENEGMPVFSQDLGDVTAWGRDQSSVKKGNLVVKFQIRFPLHIPEEKKAALRELLGS